LIARCKAGHFVPWLFRHRDSISHYTSGIASSLPQ
jgi:hypothetical protein